MTERDALMWHYKLGCWMDDQWMTLMLRWDPDRHPVLFYVGTVPLTTWFRQPSQCGGTWRRGGKSRQPRKGTREAMAKKPDWMCNQCWSGAPRQCGACRSATGPGSESRCTCQSAKCSCRAPSDVRREQRRRSR